MSEEITRTTMVLLTEAVDAVFSRSRLGLSKTLSACLRVMNNLIGNTPYYE